MAFIFKRLRYERIVLTTRLSLWLLSLAGDPPARMAPVVVQRRRRLAPRR